jgi:hypothetical protein
MQQTRTPHSPPPSAPTSRVLQRLVRGNAGYRAVSSVARLRSTRALPARRRSVRSRSDRGYRRSGPRHTVFVSEDPTGEHLDVYDTRQGWWNPDHGALEIPDGWDLLVRGDTFVTRRVKAAGTYWLAWSPRSRNRPHRTAIGLMAPKSTVDEARAAAEAIAE